MHDKIRFSCNACERSFATSQNLKGHKKLVHENIRYNCDSCEKSFYLSKTLRHHKKSVHGFKDYQNVIDELTHNKKDEVYAEKTNQDETNKGKNSQDEPDQLRDTKIKKEVKTVLEQDIKEGITNQDEFAQDELAQGESALDESDKENQTDDDEIDQDKHEYISRQFSCDMCKKVFKEMSLLESHILKEHLSQYYFKTFDKEGYFRCNSCNKTFSNSQNLKNHHQSVHDENIFRGAVIFQNKWRNFEAH